MELLTAAQMRAAENETIGRGAVTGAELMERAGAGVVAALMARWPDTATRGRAAVFCGPGNNGGDGFVIARLLRATNWNIDLFLLGEERKLPPDAAANCARWRAMGGTVADLATLDLSGIAAAGLVVDAVFGTGLSRPIPEPLSTLAEGLAALGRGRHVVAVDLPSGLCSDSGRALGRHPLRADLTVTFHSPKPGHYLGLGPETCGALEVVDIGLPHLPVAGAARLAQPGGRAGVGRLAKAASGHKFNHGHLLVLSGGVGHGGAARLAARAGLRVGAGLVTLGCPPAALMENAMRLDAIMLRALAGPEALADMLEDRRITALCLGPGLGAGPRHAARTRGLVAAALGAGRGVVLDADALTAFEAEPETLFAAIAAGEGGTVLTPHAGEFARLFPDLAAKLDGEATTGPAVSRLDAVRAAAGRAGAVVLLKGPDTVIDAPGAACVVNDASYARAAPWLATAGAGDVLAGLIAGLLARGLAPADAAESGAWLHTEAARGFGPGLISEDLPERIPRVLADLGL
ncbi:NAD(P)H-hydrate dehydratase [Paroceanicella profunda]|uniref:Bifunctional NAD(P)H-hydrate repair enzyme n=1 Tax=Paroceanicella profunda TaxID=2579971 RepID=A0A5B8FHR5_9RHOB|nr:NAD(P)H-hydrate dehydratase [Paroceanicella profunda]QDL92771.1 NAD(P)H-hydrate dehydratase [Paroceanicella profunda]